jgi:hypothetical protein
MLEHVVISAMALDPAIPLEPGHNFRPVRLGLGHGGRSMRKYWRILGCQASKSGVFPTLLVMGFAISILDLQPGAMPPCRKRL